MSENKTKIKNAAELRDMVEKLPCSGDIVERMETAKNFIKEYITDCEDWAAEITINHVLKEHFFFKTGDLKLLLKFRAQCKKEAELREKENFSAQCIPEWYKISENGPKLMPGVLSKHIAETENVIYVNSEYYIYNSGVYLAAKSSRVRKIIQQKLLRHDAKNAQIIDVEEQLKLLVERDASEVNTNPYVINLKNSFFNVAEGKTTPHTPKYISTIRINANYDESAVCPNFQKFLYTVTEGDLEQVNLIQEIIGYLLIPVTSAQKSFIFYGKAASGKSVLLNVITEIIGKNNVSNVALQQISDRFKTAELNGKLANIFADLPDAGIKDTGIFKALVGEDYINCEKKHKDPFDFKSTARMLFSCNRLPENFGDNSDGFYRRILIIPFNRTIPENERDPQLTQKLITETDGIFMFALSGLKRLIANNFIFSETNVNKDIIKKYKSEGNSVLAFINDSCVIDATMQAGSSELYEAYKKYCEECGFIHHAMNKFISQITLRFPVERKTDSQGQKRIISGIAIAKG